MNPFLSTATLFGVNELPENAEERKTLLRAARRRWQADFQLEGESITLFGNTFTLNDILQRIEACDEPEEVSWRNRLNTVPDIQQFLETGVVKHFLLNTSIVDWPEAEAQRTRQVVAWQYVHLFRRAWKNTDTVMMKDLNRIVIPVDSSLAEALEDLRSSYCEIEMEKLHEALQELSATGKAGAALEVLKDEAHLRFWMEALQEFPRLKDIYSGWYYELKNREAPREELDAVIAGCEAAMPLFGEYNWDMRLLIADHKKPVVETEEDEYEEEATPGYNPKKRKTASDDDDDPFPEEKKKWYAVGPATLIPFSALVIALGFIGWGVWSATRDGSGDGKPKMRLPAFELRYYLKPRSKFKHYIFANNRRFDYDSIAEAAFYKAGGGNGGLTEENKIRYDSILEADVTRVFNGDTTLINQNRRKVDSLTPLVLPQRERSH